MYGSDLGELKEVVQDQNLIRTTIGDLEYDVLVLATGAGTQFLWQQSTGRTCYSP